MRTSATTPSIAPDISTNLRAPALRAFALALALVAVGVGLVGIRGSSFAQQTGGNSAAEAAAAAPACDPNWQIVPSPDPGTGYNSLGSVAVVSPTEVWAVGYYSDGFGPDQTLVERWDGSLWNIVPSRNQGTSVNEFRSVAAVSPTEVWAVGDYWNDSGIARTLIERWDGTQWSIVPSPNQSIGVNKLYSVAAVSAGDIWAVGYYGSGLLTGTLIEHWNGTQWSIVDSPDPSATGNWLFSVAAAPSTEVWAVGYYYGSGAAIDTLVERWNGTSWNVVDSPNPAIYSALSSVAAVSPTDVWAVGSYYTDPYSVSYKTLVERWDGTSWNVVDSPNQENVQNNWLYSVAVVSSTDVWAVGSYYISPDTPIDQTLVEHWDGSQWSIVSSPNHGTDSDELFSVAVASSNDVWAVGYYNFGLGSQTLVERYNPCPPTPTPTVTGTPPTDTPTDTPTGTATPTLPPGGTFTPVPPTGTPSGATTTPIPPTATATTGPGTSTPQPTPIACSITFSDVPQGSTFYPYIHCLACLGIVSGYDDGTFRPGNDVTRGQAAKILSNSAGYTDPIPPDRQTFEDVVPGTTFWLYIERVALHGAISGYQCGQAPAGPCVPPLNRPYFLPANNMTRGQLAKIDSNAKGYNDQIPSTQQTFEDVPPDNTFWLFIERVYLHGVINGYQCGGQGEPCPGAYFRPGNNVTRGQTAKIVANTFYPDCQTPNK